MVTPERMELSRVSAENGRLNVENEVQINVTVYFARNEQQSTLGQMRKGRHVYCQQYLGPVR